MGQVKNVLLPEVIKQLRVILEEDAENWDQLGNPTTVSGYPICYMEDTDLLDYADDEEIKEATRLAYGELSLTE